MTNTTPFAGPFTIDGEPHLLTADVLGAMETLLATMASGKEVIAIVRDVPSDRPAFGYQLTELAPSTYRTGLVIVADDRFSGDNPQDRVYYDTFDAADGWTYLVVPDHSVSFTRQGTSQKTITYVFVSRPTA